MVFSLGYTGFSDVREMTNRRGWIWLDTTRGESCVETPPGRASFGGTVGAQSHSWAVLSSFWAEVICILNNVFA